MKFLSKLAQYFGKGLQILGLFQPVIQQVNDKAGTLVQTISVDLQQAFQAVVDAEQIGVALGLKGPDKLKVAAPKIADIILRSAMLANHKIANPELFNQGVNSVAGGLADVLNSLKDDNIQVTDKSS